MNEFLSEVMHRGDFIPILAIGGGLFIGAVSVVIYYVHAIIAGLAKERTKRELASYVAAGSIDADKAVAILNAGKDSNWRA